MSNLNYVMGSDSVNVVDLIRFVEENDTLSVEANIGHGVLLMLLTAIKLKAKPVRSLSVVTSQVARFENYLKN